MTWQTTTPTKVSGYPNRYRIPFNNDDGKEWDIEVEYLKRTQQWEPLVTDTDNQRHSLDRLAEGFYTNPDVLARIVDTAIPEARDSERKHLIQLLGGQMTELTYQLTHREEPKINPDSFFDFENEKEGRFRAAWLADYIKGQFEFITLRDSEDVYWFDKNEGIWKDTGESLIQQIATETLKDKTRQMHIKETIGYVKGTTFKDRTVFDNAPLHLIPLHNGILDIKTMRLLPYLGDYFFSYKLPVQYDPKATCPKIEKFLGEIVEEKDKALLTEVPGYCLYRDYPIQKAIMEVGEGSNAKSTYLNLLVKLLGKDNVCSVSLQSLERNRFAAVNLYRKLANIYADLPNIGIKNPGTFKMLTGGDLIYGERKFKDGFWFYNHAKLIFSTNEIPYVDDESDAFFRRWIIINFPFKFEGEKDNKNLLKELTIPEELSGFLNLAVQSLKKILSEGGFSYSKTTDEIRRLYKEFSSSISSFGYNCIIESDEDYIPKDELFEAYRRYCRERKLPVESGDKFYKHIRNDFPAVDYRPEIAGRPMCFKGIKLVEAPDPQKKLKGDDETWKKQK